MPRISSLSWLVAATLVIAAPSVCAAYQTTPPPYGPAYGYGSAMPVASMARSDYGVVPGTPQAPQPVAHPAGWPGGQMPPNGGGGGAYPATPYSPPANGYPPMTQQMPVQSGPQTPWPAAQPVAPQGPYGRPYPPTALPPNGPSPAGQQPAEAGTVGKRLEGAKIMARVGSEVVLFSEVSAGVEAMIRENKGRVPDSQLEKVRKALIHQRLQQKIETKLIIHDARSTIPEEHYPKVLDQLGKQFETLEVENLMERAGAKSRSELAKKLAELGTSLEREKRSFSERILAQQWLRQQVNLDEEVTLDQMLAYYQENLDEFDLPDRAKWEHLMVRFAEHASKAEAYAVIAQMGNEVRAGKPFAEVAKAKSDGPTASKGGMTEWDPSKMVSSTLEKAIKGLPEGQLSPILQDWQGYHIIRVVERKAAGRVPFVEAQVEIREKIRQERTKKAMHAYLDRLRESVPVWTIFDDEKPEQEEITERPSFMQR